MTVVARDNEVVVRWWYVSVPPEVVLHEYGSSGGGPRWRWSGGGNAKDVKGVRK